VISGVRASVAQGRTAQDRGRLVPKTDFKYKKLQIGAVLNMHRRLRRQVDEALGQEHELAPHLRRLFRRIEKEYRRADGDRASLQRALALLSDLLQRQPDAERRRAVSPKARSVARLFDQAPFAALLCDGDRKVTAWNAAAERLFGIPPSEAVGRELSMLVFPDTDSNRAEARTDLRQTFASGDTQPLLRPTPTRSGVPRMCEWTVVPLQDSKGREVGHAVLVQERDPSRDRYALAWQGAGDGIWDWDLGTDRLWLSESWRAIVGAKDDGDAPAAWLDRIHGADRDAVHAAIRAHHDGKSPRFESEHRLRHEDGSWRWVLARGQATRDAGGKAVRFAGSMMDLTEPKATAALLQDALTRLPNRAQFLDLTKRSFARACRRQGERLAILLLDVDRFRSLNQGLGHAAGDELLVQIGQRLQTCLREGDALARQGSDEFAILLDDVKDAADAESVATRIHEVMERPFEISANAVSASVSIGVALSAPAYTRGEDLLLDADTAMYRAKARGRARSVVFDAALRDRAPHLLELEADLRQALLRDEFRVHYLPIVDIATGRIQGLEALIRWAHPTRGLISPEHFMPFAEETGLIVPIGSWLFGQAGRDFQICRRGMTADRLTLNVNLSSRQLEHGDLLEHIDGMLAEYSLDPQDLVLELTENTLQHSGHVPRMTQLRDRGVRLYMDDFGTGSCSLNSLLRSQFDSLKIDRSLFTGGSPRGQAPELVRTIVSLARDLGTQVVAEGVETAEQLGFLREVGCGAAQGFYFSPPVDSDGARSLLERGASW
jgi:diguanylate cyclase (GGDEF)-like protein/PAS domain S-box-containing protein